MKNYKLIIRNLIILFLFFGMGLMVTSCIEDESGAPDQSSGNLTVEAVDPPAAKSGDVIAITGSGLGEIRSAVFDKNGAPAEIVSTMNTNYAVVLSIPDTVSPGTQNIILTNAAGNSVNVPYKVLGFATIKGVSNYNFKTDDQITLTGTNLESVTSVAFSAAPTTELTIISKTATSLVVKFPDVDFPESTLAITNEAGVATTSQSFVSLTNAYQIFTDDYAAGYSDASWGDAAAISTAVFKSGAASVYKDYAADQWHLLGFGWTATANDNYKYLSFWMKGGSDTYDLYISTQTSTGGVGSFEVTNKITVPANVWTYYKIPVADLGLWKNGSTWNQIAWRIQGPAGKTERFYMDDLILIKKGE